MKTVFEEDLDTLMKAVITSPEDESWLFPAVNKLIKSYGKANVLEFVCKSSSPYITTLLIKAGLKGVNESLLLNSLSKDNEDEVYNAALSLAIYGHPIGFKTLHKFADESHHLSKDLIPKLDILPDLKFIKHSEAREIEIFINNKFSHIKIK